MVHKKKTDKSCLKIYISLITYMCSVSYIGSIRYFRMFLSNCIKNFLDTIQTLLFYVKIHFVLHRKY